MVIPSGKSDPVPKANIGREQEAVERATKRGAPPWLVPRAAYVHVPFCVHHCCYCDFAVVTGRDDAIDAYLEALRLEMQLWMPLGPVSSVFIGGGTPTHLQPSQLERLFALIHDCIPMGEDAEFSIEANPETLTAEKIAMLAAAGVNRVSLGAQSFAKQSLSLLERRHDASTIAQAVDRCRRAGIEAVSLDLMFGIPGESLDDWLGDLAAAVALAVDHVSTYGLTYERGTELWKRVRAGRLTPLPEDEEAAMYMAAIDFLESAGFEQYEVSNFARPGKRSRHNQVYWANHAYYGFGLGAARYINQRRETNTRSLDRYLHDLRAGRSPTQSREILEPRARALETLALNLRRCEGIVLGDFAAQTGFDAIELAGPQLAAFVESGHLARDERAIRLTRKGMCVADYLIARLWSDR